MLGHLAERGVRDHARRWMTPTSSSSTPAASSTTPSGSRSTPSSRWPAASGTGGCAGWWSPAAWCSATPPSSRAEIPEIDAFVGLDELERVPEAVLRRARPRAPPRPARRAALCTTTRRRGCSPPAASSPTSRSPRGATTRARSVTSRRCAGGSARGRWRRWWPRRGASRTPACASSSWSPRTRPATARTSASAATRPAAAARGAARRDRAAVDPLPLRLPGDARRGGASS